MQKQFKKAPLRAAPIRLSDKDGGVQKSIPVMRIGTFHHPKLGEGDITADDLRSMVKNFSDKVRGIDLAIDYAHESESIAAGWFKSVELQNGDTELWAEIDWTAKGSQVLSEKEYRYVSADFIFNYIDNETLKEYGPTLLGAGLTNRPVIKRMEPAVELSEGRGKQMSKTGKSITLDELDDKVTDLVNQMAALVKQIQDAQGKDAANEGGEGDAPKNGEDDMAEGAANKKEVADLASKHDALQKSHYLLKEQVGKSAGDAKMAEKKVSFDKLLSEGKAVEAQRQPFMDGDMIKFSELHKPMNSNNHGHGGSPAGSSARPDIQSAQEEVLKLAKVRLSEGKSKSFSDAVQTVLSENSELRIKYESMLA